MGTVPAEASDFDAQELRSDASLNRTLVGRCRAFELLSAQALAGLSGAAGAAEAGRRFAALLATLKTGDIGSGLGVEPTRWRQKYLAHWRNITHVVVGGGTAVRLGPGLVEAAALHLDELGVRELHVAGVDHAALLPLIGAARSSPPTATRVAVFDFGHSVAKRGIAIFDDIGRLAAVQLALPVAVDALSMASAEVLATVQSVVETTLEGALTVDAVVI